MKCWQWVALVLVGSWNLSSLQAAPAAAATQKSEEAEVKVKLDDCPKAVQETLKKEAAGTTVKEVDKETEDGKTIYEADVVVEGKNHEIKVAEDGKLISNKLDDDKDEAGEKDQQGQHEDKDEQDQHGQHED